MTHCPLPCLSHRPRLEGRVTHYTASPFSPVIRPLLPEGTTWAGRPRGHVVPFAAYLAKGEDKTSGLRVWRNSGFSNSVRRDGVSRTNGSNDGLVRQSRGSPNGIRKCQLPQLTQRLIRGAHQAPFCARGLLKTGAVSENAHGAHRNVPRFGGRSTRRWIFHMSAKVPRTGGCSTEVRHLAGGIASGAAGNTVTATAPTPPATSVN